MKKVVILSAFLSPFRSGAEACAEEVPLHLHDAFDFVIVTARLRRDLLAHDMLGGRIPIRRIGIGHPMDKWLYPFLAPFAVRKLRPALVHAILETYAGLALAFCRFVLPGTPRLLTLQTTNRSFLKSIIIRSAHRVTAISRHLQEIAKAAGAHSVTLIPNGIDLASIRSACAAQQRVPGRVLFVGRLEHFKGVDVLLRAFSVVAEANKEVHLRIAGDGSKLHSLEQLAQSLSIADRVTFVGRVAPDRIAEEYAQAEIFCGLSRSEGLGNVFLEAQAAGCAVLATRVGGIPDIVAEGKGGLLVSPDSVQESADALRVLLEDAELRTRLTVSASAYAQDYDWSAIAAQYADVYRA